MTAIKELEEPTLQMTNAGRTSREFRKNSNYSGPQFGHLKAGSLYQYLDMEHLIDAFIARLSRMVPIDALSFSNPQVGQSFDKRLFESAQTFQHVLDYKLVKNGCNLGRLTLSRHHQFLSTEVRCVNASVDALSGPLHNASMYWRACQSAYLDTLTGVRNRAALDVTLSQLPPANDSPDLSALMVCDVDRFKSINDNCGHKVGDAVLRQFAGVLQSSIRQQDLVYRYGGDEFVVVLTGNSGDSANESAERIRRSVEQTALKTDDAHINLTTTIGLTGLKAGESLDEAFLRADAALLFGKKNGKNQVICR